MRLHPVLMNEELSIKKIISTGSHQIPNFVQAPLLLQACGTPIVQVKYSQYLAMPMTRKNFGQKTPPARGAFFGTGDYGYRLLQNVPTPLFTNGSVWNLAPNQKISYSNTMQTYKCVAWSKPVAFGRRKFRVFSFEISEELSLVRLTAE